MRPMHLFYCFPHTVRYSAPQLKQDQRRLRGNEQKQQSHKRCAIAITHTVLVSCGNDDWRRRWLIGRHSNKRGTALFCSSFFFFVSFSFRCALAPLMICNNNTNNKLCRKIPHTLFCQFFVCSGGRDRRYHLRCKHASICSKTFNKDKHIHRPSRWTHLDIFYSMHSLVFWKVPVLYVEIGTVREFACRSILHLGKSKNFLCFQLVRMIMFWYCTKYFALFIWNGEPIFTGRNSFNELLRNSCPRPIDPWTQCNGSTWYA